MMLPDSDDTIVAISTPPGIGGIGIVRISGKRAFTIADHIIDSNINIIDARSHTIHHGFVRGQADSITDEVLVSVFHAPTSYTGEDVVEISAHGNPQILKQIVSLAIDAGARQAVAGEFTMRAFLSGRIDLIQAESVADLIAAESASSQQAALYQLSGGLSKYVGSMRAQLVEIAALFEAYTDFPDEEIPQQQKSELLAKLDETTTALERLAASYQRGKIIRSGIQIPIVGPPNAGKSSLFNAILAEERAIVTEIPGTTRDTISEKIEVEGLAVRFIDTAGIRETSDRIEAAGVERSQREIAAAGIIIAIFDATTVSTEEIKNAVAAMQEKATIMVINKIDLVPDFRLAHLSTELASYNPVFVSALRLHRIDEVIARVAVTIKNSLPSVGGDANLLTNKRHHVAVLKAVAALRETHAKLEKEDSFELLAFDLRQAISQLEELLGKVTSDELLGEIFSRFCIGK